MFIFVSPESPGEEEQLELVPHITLNPSFNIDMLEHLEPDLNATRWNKYLTFLKLIVNENFNGQFQRAHIPGGLPSGAVRGGEGFSARQCISAAAADSVHSILIISHSASTTQTHFSQNTFQAFLSQHLLGLKPNSQRLR